MAAAGAVDVAHLLLDFVVILVAAKVGGELFERLKQPAVIGELLAGLLVGPTVLGVVPNVFDAAVADVGTESVVLFLAELGAIILLFEVGLESHLKDLVRVGRAASWVALIGIVASVGLGYAASVAFAGLGYWADDPLFHLFVGATFAATSVGITARVLKDLGRLASNEARIILGAAVLDDVGGLLVLAIVAGLAAATAAGAGFSFLAIGKTALVAVGFLVVSFAVGLKVAPPVVARVAAFRVRGVLLGFAFLLAVLMAYLAKEAGLATIVGAFAAGIILAQTKEHHRIFEGTKPLGDVFIPFFFVVMGAAVNLREIGSDGPKILLVAGALLVVATLAKLACGFGMTQKDGNRWVVGMGMVPRGEVGLIFVVFGIQNLAIEPWQAVALILVVMVTTLVTPFGLKALYRDAPPTMVLPSPHEHRDDIGRRGPDPADEIRAP